MIFRRAFDGEIRAVSARATLWRLPYDIASELVKALYAAKKSGRNQVLTYSHLMEKEQGHKEVS